MGECFVASEEKRLIWETFSAHTRRASPMLNGKTRHAELFVPLRALAFCFPFSNGCGSPCISEFPLRRMKSRKKETNWGNFIFDLFDVGDEKLLVRKNFLSTGIALLMRIKYFEHFSFIKLVCKFFENLLFSCDKLMRSKFIGHTLRDHSMKIRLFNVVNKELEKILLSYDGFSHSKHTFIYVDF